MRTATLLIGLAPVAVVAQCSGTQYNTLPGYTGGGNCYPTSFYAAQDQGQLNPSDLPARCEAQCTSMAQCVAFVGQYQTTPNGLSSGTCFFYSSIPSGPRKCADAPTGIVAESKDTSLACFSSSSAAATAFCSSYLSIGTVTAYTSTITPRATTTSTSRAQQTSVTVTVATTTSVSLTTAVTTSTALTTTSSTTGTTTLTTTTTTVSLSFDTTSTLTTTVTTVQGEPFNKRAASVPPPACLATTLPASRISSACSCLSIRSTTVSTASTAPTATTTVAVVSTSTTLSTRVSSTTLVIQSTISTTTVTSSTTVRRFSFTVTSIFAPRTFTTTVLTSVSTVRATATINPNLLQNPGFETGSESPWYPEAAGDEGDFSIVTNPVHSGRYALRAIRTQGDMYGSIVQQVSPAITAGIKYRFTFWARVSDAINGGTCDFTVLRVVSGPRVQGTDTYKIGTTWTQISVTDQANDQADVVQGAVVFGSCTDGNGADQSYNPNVGRYLDDAAIYIVN